MNPLFIGPIAELFTGLIGIGKELIVDKDKQIEYAFKIAQLQAGLAEKMLTMTTTPKTDAFVKILYAVKELILPMLRPIGSLVLTGFGVYAHMKGYQIPEYVHVILDGAFPGWMASRHVEKNRKK